MLHLILSAHAGFAASFAIQSGTENQLQNAAPQIASRRRQVASRNRKERKAYIPVPGPIA